MTYNIRGGLGMDGRRDTRRIAQILQECSPDIICLQEVHQRLPWSGWIDQPGLLRKYLGMHVFFYGTINMIWGGYGLAVASRYPIVRTERLALPSRKEQRGALLATVAAPDGDVMVCCTHWGLNEQERVLQAQRVAEWVQQTHSGRVLVCGDFNERCHQSAVTALLAAARLIDAGSLSDQPTYPSDQPMARIDYVLYSPDMELTGCFVPESAASDHRPLVCDYA